jgi:hypothetical protein
LLTTDGHRLYLEAVEAAFGIDIDYAVLQKIYGQNDNPEKRYRPAVCASGCDVKEIAGSHAATTSAACIRRCG